MNKTTRPSAVKGEGFESKAYHMCPSPFAREGGEPIGEPGEGAKRESENP